MGLDPRQLRDLVVRPALASLGLPGGEVAERLVMGTAAHESDGLRFIHQLGQGPALSLWQIEPATAKDALARAAAPLCARITGFVPPASTVIDDLPGNLYLGAAFCRLVYYMKPFKMPARATAEELAAAWKKHWNTDRGAGTPEQFLRHYRELVAPLYPEAP